MNAIDASETINPVDQSGGFGGFPGFVLARAANIFPPRKRGAFFGVGRVANPPNPETRCRRLNDSERDALTEVSASLTLPGMP